MKADQDYALAVMNLSTQSLADFDLRAQFLMENDPQPYQSAVNTLRLLSRAVTASEKLSILSNAASKVCTSVVDYWNRQPPPADGKKKPETSVGGDELLPLMTYV